MLPHHAPPNEGKEENNFLILFHRHMGGKPEAKTELQRQRSWHKVNMPRALVTTLKVLL